ncbi:OmpA family protein [Telluribacter sp. SYSU D00476]|uniref:OmpA family protein n=1 Tax=Telluribacter sp. SYSU D00476 TaxID=2811430 RepID=UPI001FF62092|nr:OmpA family protein [Telluribacter sp. SYSU D00476]
MRLLLLFFLVLFISPQMYGQPSAHQRTITQFSITAVDQASGQEVPASFEVLVHKAATRLRGSSRPGQSPFSFRLQESDTITVVTSSAGYHSVEEMMLVSCDTCEYYQYKAVLERVEDPVKDSVFVNLKVHDRIQLDKIYFNQSSYELRPESREQLEKLYRTLRDNPNLKIEIAGHTDNVGDLRLNRALSENRAQVIYAFLRQKSIPSSRLVPRGYGHTQPVSPNDTEENRSRNRRVEFVVLEN